MRKKFVISLIALVIVSTSASAMAIGGAFSLDALGGGAYGAALSLKLDDFQPVLGISARGGGGTMNIGLTADWWMYHEPLAGIISLYVGPGGYLVATGLGGDANMDIGARVPVGFQIFPIDPLEIFVELAPSLGIALSPFAFPTFGLQAAFGFRFWF